MDEWGVLTKGVRRKKDWLGALALGVDIVCDPIILILGTSEVGFHGALSSLIGFIALKITIFHLT